MAGPPVLRPADPRALADLAVLVARAARADPGGAARLVAGGGTLAVWVSPLHGAGLPTALGLRAVALAGDGAGAAGVDATVELAALAERLARTTAELPVPPAQGATASWAGVLPPRSGWRPLPPLAVGELRAAAVAGASAIARGQERGAVWSAPLAGALDGAGAARGLAWAADALGFLGPEDAAPVAAAAAGPWVRLSTPRGHALGRRPLLV